MTESNYAAEKQSVKGMLEVRDSLKKGRQILNEMEAIRQSFITETEHLAKEETEETEDTSFEEETEIERETKAKRKENKNLEERRKKRIIK